MDRQPSIRRRELNIRTTRCLNTHFAPGPLSSSTLCYQVTYGRKDFYSNFPPASLVLSKVLATSCDNSFGDCRYHPTL